MQRVLTRRTGVLSLMVAALVLGGLASYQLAVGSRQSHAAPRGALAGPHMKFNNHPLARNPLLSAGPGNGDDDTSIQSGPSLSALCQSYLGSPNPYANPAPNVDQINGDTAVQAGSQTGCGSPQNETTIVVNPNNPNNLVAGTNDYRVFNTREHRNDSSGWAYASFDGGATWKNVQVPHLTFQTGATGILSDMDSAGDPAMSFGPNNTVYYANLVFSRLNNGSGVVVSVSHDGGLTWGEPAIVHTDGVDSSGNGIDTNFFNDKEWIAADPNSGTVYLTWTHFTFTDPSQTVYTESPILISVSHDFGATWSAPSLVSPSLATFTTGITPFGSGSNPQVGIDGTLYVPYETAVCQSAACNQPTDHDAVVVAKSTDGGQTFTNTEAAFDFDFPFNPDTGRSTLTGENFRINSFPQATIDRATGRLWITWADDRNGQYDPNTGASIKTNGDVFVITSANGTQFTHVYRIGTPDDEVYPAIAAYSGRVAVSYYTRHYDPNGINLDFAYSTATGVGNLNHTSVTRITTQSENPQVQFLGIGFVSGKVLQGEFIGDYTAVAMGTDGVFHPCWTDFRGNPDVPNDTPNQDAYTQAIPVR